MTRTDKDIHSAIPLPTDIGAGPAPTPAEEADVPPIVSRHGSGNETYATLVWRRFRRSTMGMIGLVLVVTAMVVFLTEVTSNTATASLMPPARRSPRGARPPRRAGQ